MNAFFRRRRLPLLCAATVLLHVLAIDWVGGQLAAQSRRAAPLPPSLMTAQLRLALPRHVESAAPVEEVRAVTPSVPRPRGAPRPPAPAAAVPPTVPPAAPESEASAVTAAAADTQAPPAADTNPVNPGANPDAGQAAAARDGAARAQTGTPPPPVADGAAPAADQPAALRQPSGRRYKVDLPPSADFDMEVARVDADGTRWAGVAAMSWHTDGNRYQVSVEAGISMLVTRINLLVMRSAGTVDDAGIAPDKATEKRARRAETATHFRREQGVIGFSASDASFPLAAGAQDLATVPFQLGAIGRADVNQFGGDIDIQVAEAKEANVFRFQLVGEEELDTRMGKLVTWHLSRPPKPGSYGSRLDIWLAPGMYWYPVQIRNTEASGALTTQTVTRITMTGSGK